MISQRSVPTWAQKLALRLLTPRAPRHLAARFKSVSDEGLAAVEASLRHHYFSPESFPYYAGDYLATSTGKEDMREHLSGRLETFRHKVVPWLNDARALDGASVLEIGCGTGSSTVALCEQGAAVTAVDIHERSLAAAQERCRAYGVAPTFVVANATQLRERFAGQAFDFILFFATLEHLTNPERVAALRDTWAMLPRGGLLGVIEAPNRLWFFDYHTGSLPFYHWLPDDLAFQYARFSPKELLLSLYRASTDGQPNLAFSRLGRGVSYHEFELAIKRAEELDVVSSLPIFLRKRKLALRLAWNVLAESRYASFLRKVGPKIHPGFYQRSLDLLIRKD
jgi:S-adenosylmethionine-dependent methyltransferase